MSASHATPPSRRPERPFRVLRYRDFRLIWGAELLSSTGTQIHRVAVAWQVFELTGDPLQLGLLGLARFVPLLIFGLAGGVMADRYDRRYTLIMAHLALMAISGSFAVLTASGRINLPLIYILTALLAVFSAVAQPTRHALIPTLVPTAAMPAAMTMGVLTFQAAGMAGPAVGGTLIATTGIAASYAFDAVTFGLVAVAGLALQARPAVVIATISGRQAAMEGLRFLRESPLLLGTMLIDFMANFFGASTTLMPIFAGEILGGGPQTLGWLLAAPATGAVLGATFMASAPPLRRPGLGILGAVAAYGLCLAVFGLSRNLWLSLLVLAGSGVADSISVSQRHTLRNLVTPDRLRGRIAAAHSTFAAGGPQLGEFEAGVVASLTSAPIAVAIGGVGTVLAALTIALRVPSITQFRWESRHGDESEANAPARQDSTGESIDGMGTRSI